MNSVNSFKVDHRQLLPGVYHSEVNGCHTYDIRFIAPCDAQDYAPSGEVMHTLEHFFATYFRTDRLFKDCTLYVGPMGCKTGFYLLFSYALDSDGLRQEVLKCCNAILCSNSIPGNSEIECGNHNFFDLDSTKDFIVEVIIPNLSDTQKVGYEYPYLE